MITEPLVSVLMTAYNRANFISEAIQSVLASTYRNFELIIVDDGSKDETADVARKFEILDSRVKVFVNNTNLGDYPNRNRAASYAKGKYLKYLDSDDLIYPHGLEIFVSSMEKYPDAGLCLGSNQLQFPDPFPAYIDRIDALRQHFFNSGFLNIGPSGVMINRSAFQKAGGFSSRRMVGDTELWFTLACQNSVVIAQPSLVYWRQHEGQEFYDGVRSGLYDEMNFILIKELMGKEHCTLLPGERNKVLKYYKKMASRRLIKAIIKNRELRKSVALSRKFGLNIHDYLNGMLYARKGINA